MPYVGSDFTVADPGSLESDIYSFDFTSRVTSPEVLTSAGTWSLFLKTGNDFSPKSHLIGNPALTSSLITSQQISGLVAGCTYRVQVTVLTTAGRTFTAWSHLSSVAPL